MAQLAVWFLILMIFTVTFAMIRVAITQHKRALKIVKNIETLETIKKDSLSDDALLIKEIHGKEIFQEIVDQVESGQTWREAAKIVLLQHEPKPQKKKTKGKVDNPKKRRVAVQRTLK